MSDILLFAVLPYVAVAWFLLGTIIRYRRVPFTYSTLSSQFLENRKHFWSTVPFHYGILGVLVIHLAGLLVPSSILWWNAVPARLFILELSGLALAFLALFGLINSMHRRLTMPKLKVVTNASDWILYLLLLVQIVLGMLTAIYNGWGSSWFSSSASPWLWSLIKLSPEPAYVAAMPLMIKLHIINAFLILAFFPFTRLVHILVVPNPYLWRKTQVVLWNRERRKARISD